MADFDAIRRGIAAQLRTVLPEDQGHVSAYWEAAPKANALQVEGIERMVKDDFGDGRSYLIRIEGVFPLNNEISAQKTLDGLIDTVADVIEADQYLTSRYQDDNTVLTGQAAACDAIAFNEYRGAGLTTLPGGTVKAMVAVWVAEVLA